jgi:hypothetical protein
LIDAIVAWGTVEDVTRRVGAHLDAGASHVAVQLLTSDMAQLPMAEYRRLAAALMP